MPSVFERDLGAQINSLTSRLYPPGEKTHGEDHARQVEHLSLEIAQEREYRGLLSDEDSAVLRVAAIFHDSGYPEKRPYWSGMQLEHVFEGARKTKMFLVRDNCWYQRPDLIEKAVFLVLNHDNTSFSFPGYRLVEFVEQGRSLDLSGRPELSPGTILRLPETNWFDRIRLMNDQKIAILLKILREADSRLGTGRNGAERTYNFSLSRNVPRAVNEGGILGVGIGMWQESALGNVLLAANRALLDASTKTGQSIAWKGYLEAIGFINEILMKENGQVTLPLREEDAEYIWKNINGGRMIGEVRIREAIAVNKISVLSQISSRIALRISNPEEIPTDGSVVNTGPLKYLREALLTNYAFDPLTQLGGYLRCLVIDEDPVLGDDEKEILLKPPVVTGNKQKGYSLQDGQEFIELARSLKITQIKVLNKD